MYDMNVIYSGCYHWVYAIELHSAVPGGAALRGGSGTWYRVPGTWYLMRSCASVPQTEACRARRVHGNAGRQGTFQSLRCSPCPKSGKTVSPGCC